MKAQDMNTGFEKAVSGLRSSIDRMATSLMVSGAGSIQPEHLDTFSAEAENAGLSQAAQLAASLSSHLQDTQLNKEAQRQLLSQGFADLLNTLETSQLDTEADAPTPSTPVSFSEDADLVADFITEAREHLALIESQMLDLERDPQAMEVLHSVFRTFHTIKGLAGFLEFRSIRDVAHEVETLLDLARNEKMQLTPPVVDVVLASADYLGGELSRIEAQLGGAEAAKPANNRALIQRIQIIAKTGDAVETHAASLIEQQSSPHPHPVQDIHTNTKNASPHPAAETRPAAKTPATENGKAPDTSSVRVETAKLDHLLDMVGEMVIAQSLIRHNPLLSDAKDARLLADIAQLSRNTAEVQRITMAMRMVPIGQLFQRTARLIRDLSRKAGKKIVLETSGEDTELDKTIAEELTDPLLHMVRNSVDHGIELPEDRIAAGKSPEARIFLKAYHQAGQVVIEISDDGRGLNREKIFAKAVQNGVIEATAQLSDAEICQLIFEPGFSTAEKVTDVSGRGVGMDVVRRNVEKLRGRIDLQSTPGQGTTFHLRLPLTLAIIEGLVVLVGASRYIVPIFVVKEMFRPTPDLLSTVQERHEMAMVRGGLLPIVRLHRHFAIPTNAMDATHGLLVVIECDGKQFCLLVDDLVGKQEVVIKSLGETFKDVRGLAGCAILGDGRVGLILDMEGIYQESAR
jgi:two-component system, chemotaxis family, sensor kinase CheA